MRRESVNVLPEVQVVELPALPAGAGRRSPLIKALACIAVSSLCASATYAMYFRDASRASAAAGLANLSPMDSADSWRVIGFFPPSQDPLSAMRAALGDSSGILRRLMNDSLSRQIPQAELRCNPFRQPDLSDPAAQPPPATAPSADPQPQAQRAAMLKAVESMQLQSITATGPQRSCMINGVLYDEGGTINGFTIETINAQSVDIRNGLYRFELTLSRP